jgi:hypothetical protein
MTDQELVADARRKLELGLDSLKMVENRTADVSHAIIKLESALRGIDDYEKKKPEK